MNQQFTLDRESFEQFLGAVSLFQSLQQAAVNKTAGNGPSLLQYSLETLRAVDSGTLDLQAALERVAALARQIVGGDCAVVWLFTSENLICRASVGTDFDDDHIHTALRSRLQSAGAFGTNSPSTLDLTRTLANYSSSVRSSLAIALLPGGRIAGALAVFSDLSRTFTGRDYAHLRQLAGLGQYALTKWMARQEQEQLPETPEQEPYRAPSLSGRIASSSDRSATTPGIRPVPDLSSNPLVSMPDLYVSGPGTRAALGESATKSSQCDPAQAVSTSISDGRIARHSSDEQLPPDAQFSPDPQQTSPGGADQNSPALQRWEEWKKRFESRRDDWIAIAAKQIPPFARRLNVALNATGNIFRRARHVPIPWHEITRAAPALVILAVMSFFAGLLTGGRQPLTAGSLNTVAQAAAEPVTRNSVMHHENNPLTLTENKSAPSPGPTSHLQPTDRETATAIAELSRYEVQTLRRSASSGDDQAALELGTLYELGHFLPQSCSKASVWITNAAQSGNVAAEYNLGLRYKNGDGVPINPDQSEFWLRKAAAHHNPDAARALAELPAPSKDASLSKITPQMR